MSTPFLLDFSATLVRRLREAGHLEIRPGSEPHVVRALAAHLASVDTGSLISSVAAGLLAAEDVEELYADDTTLKAMITDLKR